MRRIRVHFVSRLWVLSTVLLLLAAIFVTPLYTRTQASASRQSARPDQLIPLYEDNANDWATACSSVNGAHGGSYIIADVDQGLGPGPAPVPAWANVIDNCDGYGRASVLGYVWTDYGEGGTASIPAIEAEVEAWYSYYPGSIGGIFFDGAADSDPLTGASNQTFYQTLDAFVHDNEGNNDEVVLNYGANPGSGWMFNSSNAKNADIVVIFEGSYDTPGENPFIGGGWTPAPWESRYPADDFAALMYDTNSTATVPQPATACAALTTLNIGYLYVGTWYTNLAPYFSAFVNDC
jgi:Spherulation-specific family 4